MISKLDLNINQIDSHLEDTFQRMCVPYPTTKLTPLLLLNYTRKKYIFIITLSHQSPAQNQPKKLHGTN